jgi:glucose-1-phosphate thymidylyltransferase|tara:strand:- start:166 stop:897 length:732 start_codon:yes stop_codon:yes gene_type:complete
MDVVILAAGYATRLYPLTDNTPKPLLKVAGKPIVEHIISKLEELDDINNIYLVTNDKFEQNFIEWSCNFNSKKPIEIINDNTKSNDDRLGALGDINHAINAKKIDDDFMVIAGDNLFEFSLQKIINLFEGKKSNIIALCDVKDLKLAKHYGVVEIENDIVAGFEEKPSNPKSTLISTGIYLFPKKTILLIKQYIDEGNNPDKTGSFIEWLHKREIVYVYITDKAWYDIGNFEQLEVANKHYED